LRRSWLRFLRMILGAGREGPCRCGSADKRDELAVASWAAPLRQHLLPRSTVEAAFSN
jgi:hypothetical protein